MPRAKNADMVLTPPQTLVNLEQTPKVESDPSVPSKQRPNRIPVSGNRDILTVKDKDPNFHYRWVIDRDERLEKFKLGGYEVVVGEHEIGDETVNRGHRLGSAVTHYAGGGDTLVLMRIPLEWYDEDQLAKQIDLDAKEETMRGASSQAGHYGAISTHGDVGRSRK